MGCSVVLRPQIYNEVRGGKLIFCDSCQRILYYDASKEVAAEASVERTTKRRAHPKIDASQAWYYRGEYGESGEVFLSFSNTEGSAHRRVYDAATGRKLGETLVREGGYRQAFPEDLTETVRLNGNWGEAELDGWGDAAAGFGFGAGGSGKSSTQGTRFGVGVSGQPVPAVILKFLPVSK
jgi:hypothetical protein